MAVIVPLRGPAQGKRAADPELVENLRELTDVAKLIACKPRVRWSRAS